MVVEEAWKGSSFWIDLNLQLIWLLAVEKNQLIPVMERDLLIVVLAVERNLLIRVAVVKGELIVVPVVEKGQFLAASEVSSA